MEHLSMSDGKGLSSVRSGRPQSTSRSGSGSPSARSPGRSPPPSAREAEHTITFISVSRPSAVVHTKFDEHLELQKQYSEKEACRQKFLEKAAFEEEQKSSERSRLRQQWRKRMHARETAVRNEREFRENERKLALQDWQRSVHVAQQSQKARITRADRFVNMAAADREKNIYERSILHFVIGNFKGRQEGAGNDW